MNLEAVIRRQALAVYFGVAYLVPILAFLAIVGPRLILEGAMRATDGLILFPIMEIGICLTGIMLTRVVGGTAGVRGLLARMGLWQVPPAWYLTLLIAPVSILGVLFGLSALASPAFAPKVFPLGILFGLFAGIFEEIGWTGFAYPHMRLRSSLSALGTATILGLLWGLWHVFVVDDVGAAGPHGIYWLPFFLAFVGILTAVRILIVWVYSNTESLLLAQLLHASLTGSLVVLSPVGVTPGQEALWYALFAVVLWIIVAVVARCGPALVQSPSLNHSDRFAAVTILRDRKTPRRGVLVIWSAALILGASAAHVVGLLSQPPGSAVLTTLVLGVAVVQLAAAVAVVGFPTRRVLVAATIVEVVALLLWSLSRQVGVPLGATVWRPETLGAMDFFLPVLEGMSVIFVLALVGRTLPSDSFGSQVLTALPAVFALGVLILAATHRPLTEILLVVVFFTTGYPASLVDLYLPIAGVLLLFLLSQRFSKRLRAVTPGAGRTVLGLLAALLLTSLLAWGAAETAADRPWLPTPAIVEAPAGQTTTLAYCAPNNQPLAMDVTEPAIKSARPAPVALYVHGGAGLDGDRVLQGSEGPYLAQIRDTLVSEGFVVGSIDYGLAPQHPLAEEVEDTKCAVRFLRAHSAALNIDPKRIGVYGDSEGGYVAAMLGTTNSRAGYDVGQYLDQSSDVQAVVDMWGFTDLTNWTGSPSWVSGIGKALGAGTSSPDRARVASPINDVKSGDPPFLIIHGTDDWFIAPHHSQDFAQRLQAAGVPAQLVMVEHGGHGLDAATSGQVQQPGPSAIAAMVAQFFVRTLG